MAKRNYKKVTREISGRNMTRITQNEIFRKKNPNYE